MELKHKVKTYFIFQAEPAVVFEICKNISKTDNLFAGVRSPTQILKGSNTYSVGNKFRIEINSIPFVFEVEQHECLKDYKCIRWRLSVFNFIFILIVNVYRCCVSQSSIVETTLEHSTPDFFELHKLLNDNREYMIRLQEYVKNLSSNSKLTNSKVIRADRSSLAKLILDLNQIPNSSKYFGQIKYEDIDSFKIGNHITFSIPFLCLECKFAITESQLFDKRKKWTYSLKLVESQFSSISEIIMTIYKLRSKKCVYSLTAVYKDNVQPKRIEQINMKQVSFIKDMISCLEDSSSKNNK